MILHFLAIILLVILIAMQVFLARGRIVGGRDKLMAHKKRYATTYSLAESNKFIDNDYTREVIGGCKTHAEYSDIEHELTYHRTTRLIKTNLHVGQLKLFLTELQFLTECLPAYDAPAFVIYAGSSPSHKMAHLAEMFPGAKFILVDPNEHYVMYPGGDQYSSEHIDKFLYFVAAAGDRFSLGPREINLHSPSTPVHVRRGDKLGVWPDDIAKRIRDGDATYYMIEAYMDMRLATALAPLSRHGAVYFISDIRSLEEGSGAPTDLDILWNSAMMYNWLRVLHPVKYMLKFHPPYMAAENIDVLYAKAPYMHEDFLLAAPNVDFIEDYRSGVFRFLRPDKIYLQAFAGPTSSETRLVGSTMDIVQLNHVEFENKLFYYDRIVRQYGWHTEHEEYLDPITGIDRCGDCALMCKIFVDYSKKYGFSTERGKIVGGIIRLLKTIKRKLVAADSTHGLYFAQYPSVEAVKDNHDGLISLQIMRTYFGAANAEITKAAPTDLLNRLRAYEKLDAELTGKTSGGKSGGALLYNTMKVGDLFGFNSQEFKMAFEFSAERFLPAPVAEELTKKIVNIMGGTDVAKPTVVGGQIEIGKYKVANLAPGLPIVDALATSVYEIGVPASAIGGKAWVDFIEAVCVEYKIKTVSIITTTPLHSIELPRSVKEQKLYLYNCAVNWMRVRNIEGKLVVLRLPQVSEFVRHFIEEFILEKNLRCIIIQGTAKPYTANLSRLDIYGVTGISPVSNNIGLVNISPLLLDRSEITITQKILKNKICWVAK